MELVCQQPHYLPWIGYFEQLVQADRFVFLDSVQWIRQGRQHRTKINSRPAKQELWLTIPVHGHDHRKKQFKEIQIDQTQNWANAHWKTVQCLYGKAPCFKSQIEPILRPFYEKAKYSFLQDVCQESTYLFWEHFGIQSEIYWSSEMGIQATEPSERLVEICESLKASTYYSALGSSQYLDTSKFRAKNINVRWQHFRPIFPGDISRSINYSILDWMAHLELDVIKKILYARKAPRFQELPAAY